MELITKEEMKRIDSNTCKICGSYSLMESAGNKMYKIIKKYYSPKNVLLALGTGGNAGDALVVGRLLLNDNINVDAYIVDEIKNADAITNLNKFNGNIVGEIDYSKYDLIIDGLYGIGLNRLLSTAYINLINDMNNSNIDIVSLDIPSGIDASTGISYGAFVKSKLCITVEYLKTGMFLNDGLDSYQKYEIISVGMEKPNDLIHSFEIDDFKNMFPERLRNTNKGSFHKASIMAGSKDYPGASKISYLALASFKMGVGFQNLFVPESLYNIYCLANPEIITNKLSEIDGHIKYNEEELNQIIKRSDAISIGMGMTVSEDLYQTIKYLLLNYDKKLIIDADGLNTLSKYGIDILLNKKCDVILTPHLKEFERLTGINVDDIKSNQLNISLDFAKKYNVTLILKSSSIIITDGKNIGISNYGNSGLAKAGSGDSLTGILTGLFAYLSNSTYNISALGAYIFGMSAETLAIKNPEETITITEIIKMVPKIITKIKSL